MATQHNLSLEQNNNSYNPAFSDCEPLQLDEMLTLIMLASKRGYSVKSARDMKAGYDPILAEVYSVWFAIENELSIFTDNIPGLIRFTGLRESKARSFTSNVNMELSAA